MNKVFRYAQLNFVRAMVGLITAEQLATAAATALLALAGKSIHAPKTLIALIAAFMIVSQIPNLILSIFRRTEMRGYLEMYRAFLEDNLLAHAGRTRVWAARGQKEMFLAAVGSEAETYLSAVAFSHFDLYTYGLGILLNATAFAVIIDSRFLGAFLLSGLLGFAFYRLRAGTLNALIEDEQKSRLDLRLTCFAPGTTCSHAIPPSTPITARIWTG